MIGFRKIGAFGFLVFLCCYAVISSGVRDVFKIEQCKFIKHPLLASNLEDLSFVGSVLQNTKSIGFLEDSQGNIHAVSIGQSMCQSGVKVIKILSDQILVLNGQNIEAIK